MAHFILTNSSTLCLFLVKIKETTFLRNTIAECLACGKKHQSYNQTLHLKKKRVTIQPHTLISVCMRPQDSEAVQPTQVHLQVLEHLPWILSLWLSAYPGPVSDRTCASLQSQGLSSVPPVQMDIRETEHTVMM